MNYEVCWECIGGSAKRCIECIPNWYSKPWVVKWVNSLACPSCEICQGTGTMLVKD